MVVTEIPCVLWSSKYKSGIASGSIFKLFNILFKLAYKDNFVITLMKIRMPIKNFKYCFALLGRKTSSMLSL